MTQTFEYPHFVADQVLTAQNLNDSFNFLDEQNRLTRSRLLGIGIVCGLDVTPAATQIAISRGTGITSKGYLAIFEGGTYTHYKSTPYQFPVDSGDLYGSYYSGWSGYELLTSDKAKATDIKLDSNPAALSNMVVVLFAELSSAALKNCTNNDCDDKGEVISLTIRPLLVDKTKINATSAFGAVMSGYPVPSLRRLFFDSDGTSNDVDAVYQGFETIIADKSLWKKLQIGLNKIYADFKPLFYNPASNPFDDVAEKLLLKYKSILRTNPLFHQYCYDHLDDLVKAYNEFYHSATDIISECCPSDQLFPMHLMLGEATKNSATSDTSYRNAFLFSPLFDQNSLNRKYLKSQIRRLADIVSEFEGETFSNMLRDELVITPSRYGDHTLSGRCIPYYYKPEGIFQNWNFQLSRYGRQNRNLSYHADSWSEEDAILNPFEYDIEPYNFYRIEGHLGKSVSSAYRQIMDQRTAFNLAFDVIGLNMGLAEDNLKFTDESALYCKFKDLESGYNLAIVELLEMLQRSVCFFSNLSYIDLRTGGTSFAAGFDNADAKKVSELQAKQGSFLEFTSANSKNTQVNCFTRSNSRNFYARWVNDKQTNGYNPGDLVSELIKPASNTTGEFFVSQITEGNDFGAPDNNYGTNAYENLLATYDRAFYFLQLADNLMAAIFDAPDLAGLNYTNLSNYVHQFENFVYKLNAEFVLLLAFGSAVGDPNNTNNNEFRSYLISLSFDTFVDEYERLLDTAFEEKVQSLYFELLKRKKSILEELSLGNYMLSHPGLEHKAGVPKGGTFVLLYCLPEAKNIAIKNPGAFAEVVAETKAKDKIVLERKVIADAIAAKEEMVVAEKVAVDDAEADVLVSGLRGNYKRYTPGKKGTAVEMDKIMQYIHTKGIVFADLYLPYICCGGCGSPAIWQSEKPVEEVPKISLSRSIGWSNPLNLDEVISSVASEAQYAGGYSWTNKAGLTISDAGQITALPFEEKVYSLTYQKELNGVTNDIELSLSVTIKSINLDLTTCYTSDTIDLQELLGQDSATKNYSGVLAIESANGLTVSGAKSLTGIPKETKTYSIVYENYTDAASKVTLLLTINFPDPGFQMTLHTDPSTGMQEFKLIASHFVSTGSYRWFMVFKDTKGTEFIADLTKFNIDGTPDRNELTISKLSYNLIVETVGKMMRSAQRTPDSSGFIFRFTAVASQDQKDLCRNSLDSDKITAAMFKESTKNAITRTYKI